MKKLFLIYVFIFCNINGQELQEIKIKRIQNFEKIMIFEFKDLKTKKIDYLLSYKGEICCNYVKIKKGKKYKIELSEINVWHQNDGHKYILEFDGFTVPLNHKLYYSENIRGIYYCKKE